ncbi:ABC transporter substrate-binding protein [Actinoplanes sp. NPDC000266]
MPESAIARPPWRRASIAGVALFSTLLTACSGSSASPATQADAPKLTSTAGKAAGEVGTVTWNLTAGEPDTLDPPNAATYSGGQVVMNLCDTLVRYDADYNMSPGLADYKQESPTKLVYTLRAGARFWDGKPVTVDDIVYSLQRAKKDSIVSSFFASVASIEATSDKQVTVTFSTPDQKFNTEMTDIAGVIYEKAFAEKAGKNLGTSAGGLMCSGPFKLDGWASGDSITMSRNESYWDTSRKPLAKQVKFTFVTDATNLTQALESGDIDGAYQIPPAAIPALQKAATGKIYFGPSTEGVSLMVANPGGVTADTNFMNGLQRIIDREALVKAIYHGAAEPLYTAVTPRTWPTDQTAAYQQAYQQFVTSRSYDLAAAKEQIGKSAYKGESLVLAYASGDPTTNQLAQLIQQQAGQAGVTVKLQSMGSLAFSQANYDASKRKDIDLLLGASFNSVADPLEPLLFEFLPGSPYNYTGHNDKELIQKLNQAAATFDDTERAKLLIEAQPLWEKANTLVPLVSSNTVTFLNKRLAGAVTSFAYWSMPNMAFVGSAS